MRRTILALVLCLPLLPAAAQDKGNNQNDPELQKVRAEVAEKTKEADEALATGDPDAALRLQMEAIRILAKYRAKKAGGAGLGFAAPKRRVVVQLRQPKAAPPAPGPMPKAGAVQASLEKSLKWLASAQDVAGAGGWDCGKHGGNANYGPGVTGLALLAFLNAGHTDKGGPYATNVKKGLEYLVSIQDGQGCFGARASQHFIYNHIIGTHALCEGYARTQNAAYLPAAKKAAAFLMQARNPFLGWRYGVRGGENDTSVTTWAVLALRAAQGAGIEVDDGAFTGAKAWIDKMTDGQFGQTGYLMPGGTCARPEAFQDKFPPENSQAMTAAGLLARIHCGEQGTETMKKSAQLLAAAPPRWEEGHVDMVYWHFGTKAMRAMQAQGWQDWQRRLVPALVGNQKPDGSWDPAGPWGPDGGRIYSTGLMTLSLQEAARAMNAGD